MDDTKPKTWRAILTPHRSLSPKGFVILMSVIAGFNFIVGIVLLCHRGLAGGGFHGA